MTTSELIRWIVVGILLIVAIARRMGLFKKFQEKRQEQEKKAALEQRKARRKEQHVEQQRRLELKKRQTAEILQQSLVGMRQQSAQVGSMELWYAEGGTPGDRNSVVLLHGFGGDKECWNDVAQLLMDEGWHVIAPDLPGFGQNARNPDLPYDITNQAKRVRALMHRAGVKKAHWVGHSVGGTLAAMMAYGVSAEVASLTLIEPFGVRVAAETELDTYLGRGLNPLFIAAPTAYDNLLGFLYHEAPEMPAALKEHRAQQAAKDRAFHLKVWQQVRGGDQAHLLDMVLPEVSLPTLVLHGAQSRVIHPTTAQAIVSMMPNARGGALDGCGHMVMVEKSQIMAQHLIDFLASIEMAAAPS